jgi:transcriptional regulator with XRE-family HTH domain
MSDRQDWLTFRDMLRGYRKDVGMTQAKFGEAIGYSTAYVCDIELGHRKPSVQFVENFTSKMSMPEGEATIWHKLGAKANGWKV